MRTRLLIGSAAVAVVLFGACGSGGDAGGQVASLSGATATTKAKGKTGDRQSFQDALLEHARCMRDHGVDMPDPTFDGEGKGFIVKQAGPNGMDPDSSTFKAAEKACEHIMKEAEQNMPRPSAEELAKMRDRAVKFARCMREHGVDMPDPTFDGDGRTKIEFRPGASGGATAGRRVGPAEVDEDFEAAMKACEKDSPMKIARGGR